MKKLKQMLDTSVFRVVFSKDEMGRGRFYVLMSGILGTVFSAFVSGTFYTGFLLAMGIDIVNIGIVTSISLITSFFNLFSPMLLNRFPKRKKLLIITRIGYHVFNILGITLLPFLPLSVNGKIVMVCVCVFISGAISNLTAPGYSTWHISYTPTDEMRTNFFSLQMIINGVVSAAVVLISGQVANIVTALGHEVGFIVVLRIVAFAVALFEVYCLTRPREPEYKQTGTGTSFVAIFREPFRYKFFLLTVVIVFVWNFSAYLSSSAWSAYVLDTLRISYGEITLIDSLYCIFLLVLVPQWRKYLGHHSLLRVLMLGMLTYVPTLLLAVVSTPANAFWIYPVMRILQHINGTCLNLCMTNLPWYHMPLKDRTTCLAFYTLCANLFAFLGQVCGTAIIAAAGDKTYRILPFLELGGVQMTLLLQSGLVLLIVLYIALMRRRLESAKDAESQLEAAE